MQKADDFTIADTTLFGANTTNVVLGGAETQKATRGGRKHFMLSGYVAPTAVINGKTTTAETVVIQCRLYERGDGWATKMERTLLEDGRLQERNVLVRPDAEDIVVNRYFVRRPSTAKTGVPAATQVASIIDGGSASADRSSAAATPATVSVMDRPQAMQAALGSACLLAACVGACCRGRSQ